VPCIEWDKYTFTCVEFMSMDRWWKDGRCKFEVVESRSQDFGIGALTANFRVSDVTEVVEAKRRISSGVNGI
jgi:hypothetical protein